MGIKRYDIDDSIEYRGFLLENNAGGSLVSYSDYAFPTHVGMNRSQ